MALPDGYKQVEYIQSSGTQYINTGFNPNNNTRVLIDYESLTTATAFVFGSRHNSSANSTSYSFSFVNIGANSVRSDYGSVESSISDTVLKRVILDKNKNVTTYDGSTVTATAQSFQSSYEITLCCVNTAGTKGTYSSLKLYSCKIYDNGTLVRDFVPCTNASGTAGLYDTVNSKFYGNAGSGSFTAGAEVNVFNIPGEQNIGGVLKSFVDGYVNVGGVLKKLLYGYQNVGGVLVPLQIESDAPVEPDVPVDPPVESGTCQVAIYYTQNSRGEIMTIEYTSESGNVSTTLGKETGDGSLQTKVIECVKDTNVYLTYKRSYSTKPTVSGNGSFVSSTSAGGTNNYKNTIYVSGDCTITAKGLS